MSLTKVGMIYSLLQSVRRIKYMLVNGSFLGTSRIRRKSSDAVKRKVMEELGAEIEITGLQDPIEHSYNHVKIRLLPYECKLTNNSPEHKAKEMEHSKLVWVQCWDIW